VELGRLNCAGVGCADREGCRRYRIRLPRLGEVEHKIFDWASFDVERELKGDCVSLIKYRE
jgi:hypothetical protein